MLGQLLLFVGFVGMLAVDATVDYDETVMYVFQGIFAAGLICFFALALALIINIWFFKEID